MSTSSHSTTRAIGGGSNDGVAAYDASKQLVAPSCLSSCASPRQRRRDRSSPSPPGVFHLLPSSRRAVVIWPSIAGTFPAPSPAPRHPRRRRRRRRRQWPDAVRSACRLRLPHTTSIPVSRREPRSPAGGAALGAAHAAQTQSRRGEQKTMRW